MSQPESQPVPEEDEETFLLSSLTEDQSAVFKRKLKREVKSLVEGDDAIVPPAKIVDMIDGSQMKLASNLIKSTAGAIVASRGDKILEQIAEATEASWVNQEKAQEWLTNFVSRTMRQAWMVEAMKWLDTTVGKNLGVKPMPFSEGKIAWAHLDDCVQEAIELMQASNSDILDSQEEDESEEDSEDGDSDDDSDKSISGSSSEEDDDDSASEEDGSDIEIDEDELKAEAKVAGIKKKKRKRVEEEAGEEAAEEVAEEGPQ